MGTNISNLPTRYGLCKVLVLNLSGLEMFQDVGNERRAPDITWQFMTHLDSLFKAALKVVQENHAGAGTGAGAGSRATLVTVGNPKNDGFLPSVEQEADMISRWVGLVYQTGSGWLSLPQ